MTFKKEIVLPMTGLVSVCLISVYYVICVLLHFFRITVSTDSSNVFISIIPLLAIIVLISIRYILVVISNLNQFKRNLDPLIIVQVISLLIIWTIKLQVVSSKQIIIPIIITGFIGFVMLLWFVFTLAEIEDDEVVALSYLKYFVIVFLLFLVINILPDILTIMTKRVYESLDNTLYLIDGLKYIILIPFFLKNLAYVKSERINTSA
jgi:hypothetical protein